MRPCWLTGEDFYRVWGELFYSVQTGEPAFDRVYGLSNWAYRQQHPEANARFNALMASMARRRAAGVLSTYRFAGHRVVVDVGGGNGTLLVALLRHYPELRGMLVDQPHVIAQAHTVLATAGVADRCIVLEGDFFAEVPAGGDFYILSEILHDWSDARASDILVRCHRAMASGAKLLIVERVVPKGNDPSPAKLIDIQMLVTNAGGRERTEHEWRRLVESAGFRLQSIVRTGEPWDILEAVPDRSCRSS